MNSTIQTSAPDGTYGVFEIAKLRRSPDNRKRFNEQALQELAASIKSMGVAQPILIRPVTPTAEEPEEFEIVAGERRFRASKLAGMTTIPAMCRNLSNLDAAKIRILENLQREDPHPIEEAEGYQQLMLQHGYSADQLAEEIKKSRAYIYGRLKLCALTTEVREQFLEDKIPASTALLIARIPVPALQVKALNEITQPWGPHSEPLSYRKAVEHIQKRYMLDLSTAIFKLKDSNLLASAGACTRCPKRTGNAPDLYPSLSADVCTDPDCFAEKSAAHHAALLVQANKNGIPVYEGDDASPFLSNRWSANGDHVFADTSIHLFARNAPETKNSGTPATYLKENMPPVVGYVKRNDGEMLAVYARTAMQAALEAAGACETVEAHAARMEQLAAEPATPPKKSAAVLQREAEQAEHQRLVKLAADEEAFRITLMKKLRERGAAGFTLQTLREFTKHAIARLSLPVQRIGGCYDFDTSTNEAIFRHIDQAGLPEVQLLLVDALLSNSLQTSWWAVKNGEAEAQFMHVMAMCRSEGIDPDQVREELFPSPIDVTAWQYGDLVAFIGKYPQRLNELAKILLTHPRGDLCSMLDRAAKESGYVSKDGAFALPPAAPAAEAPTQAAPQQASVEAVDDGDDLAGQMAEVEAAKPAPKQPTAKASKPKSAPTAAAKSGKKAPPAKPANKAAKKAAPTSAKSAAADPWPFPKSSTQPREQVAAANPAAEAVQA